MIPDQNNRRRIDQLERKITTLEKRLERLANTSPLVETDSRQIRLAQTMANTGETYPVDSNSNYTTPKSFRLKFINYYHNETIGSESNGVEFQVNSRNNFTTGSQAIGVSIDGQYYPEDTTVVVIIENGTVAIIGSVGSYKPLVRFKLTSDLTHNSSTASATILQQMGPFKEQVVIAGGITVNNFEDSSSLYQYSGVTGKIGLAFWDYGTNYWIIDLEC